VSGGDIESLKSLARSLVRNWRLESREAAEEFFKLCLELALEVNYARSIRDAVLKVK
jgi:hypothetical protein